MKSKTVSLCVEVLEDRCLLNATLSAGPNVNISRMSNVQAEGTIAIDPTNKQRLFSSSVTYNAPATTNRGLFAGYSVNGELKIRPTGRRYGR